MKTRLLLKPLLAVLLLALLPQAAAAYDFMVDGLCYNKNSDGTSVTVTYETYDDTWYSVDITGGITIPETVTYNGTTYSVTSIGDDAFYECHGLTSVTIPNSVTSIGKYAFWGCSGLTSVTIGNSVTSIGNYAFASCSRLTGELTIPNSVSSIGSYAFEDCTSLTSVTIGNSVTSIGDCAFSGCSGLTSVTIPNSVTSIGGYAFWGCSGLTSVTIGNSVTSIGNYAFEGTAWYNNQPDGLVYAGLIAYKYKGTMPNGTCIEIQEGTKSILSECFKNCSGLTELTIPNSVTSIGNDSFYGCSGLTSVTIGNSVTSIGSRSFQNCSGLTSVTIPNSVTSIGERAFYNCSGLTSVTIGNSVTSIGNYAFSGCRGLTDINSCIENPTNVTLGSYVFYGVPTNACVLHVPVGTVAAYRAASQWSAFTNIVEMEPPTVLATSLTLNETVAEVTAGETLQLTVTVLPEDATDKSVAWGSSNEAVATVDATGLVTAVAAGTATITATTNDGSNLAASCEITVEATAANRLDVQNYTVLRGHSLTLPVQLINTATNLTALQADIHLPEGITIEMDGDEYVIDLVSDRVARDHTLASSQLASSGAVRVLIASQTKKLFTGNSGDLFTISLLTSDEMSAGDYAVTIDNIVLSDNEATTYHAPDVTSTITVKDVEMGDATGDGQINVGDYVATAGYILEEDPQPFVFAAADIDANGTIDVGDLVGVAGIILSTESPAGMPAHQAAASGTANLGVKCNSTGDGHYLVTIDMSNDASVTAMQMDLTLPDGLRLAEASLTDRASGSHAVDFNRLHNGDWRVLAASGSNKAFRDTEGAVLTLELEGDGEGNCSIENIMLAQPNGARIVHDNLNFEVGLTTGVTDVYSKVNIYAQGDMLIVESPHDTVAQLVMPNGTSRSLRVSAGRNVYRLGHVGYVFVKVDNQVAKFRF